MLKYLGGAILAICILGLANGAAEQGVLPKIMGILTFMGQILIVFSIGMLCVKMLSLQVLHAAIAGAAGGSALAASNSASYWLFSAMAGKALGGFSGAFVNTASELIFFVPVWAVIGCLFGAFGALAASRGTARESEKSL